MSETKTLCIVICVFLCMFNLNAQKQYTFYANTGLNYVMNESANITQGVCFQVGTDMLLPTKDSLKAFGIGAMLGYKSFYNPIEGNADRSNFLRVTGSYVWNVQKQWTTFYIFGQQNFSYRLQQVGLGVNATISQKFIFNSKIKFGGELWGNLQDMKDFSDYYIDQKLYGGIIYLGFSRNF